MAKTRYSRVIKFDESDLTLPLNSMAVLNKRYLLKDDNRNIIETVQGLFKRVASYISLAEKNFRRKFPVCYIEEKFYRMMSDLEFLPNSPTLMNAGAAFRQLSACFVIPVEDSIDAIFKALSNMAKVHQTGGGTGFDFSRLRPKGDLVNSTKGEASGPISFMKIFNNATGVIVQGGRRRGANMGILRCDHPDIFEFVEAKTELKEFANFNLSVGITDKFMERVKKNKKWELINPRTKKAVKCVSAKALFDSIVHSAWLAADPGLIFLDEINRHNPTPQVGCIEATNPCGELPLLPYESCNLASINLSKMVKGKSVDWRNLSERIYWAVRFLDDAIEVNKFVFEQTKKITFANRKIGLGVMGFADMLISLGISYSSKKAVDFSGRLMRFIRAKSIEASLSLAKDRGVFPNFRKSVYAGKNLRLRNSTVNTIAPTGSISIIAGCSSGIEPLFAISFVRNVLSGERLFEINPLFEETAKRRKFYSKEMINLISRQGSIQNIEGIPKDVKRLFVTAFDINPGQHLKIQSAFQKHCDNAVSKTINLPASATEEDVRKIYLLAYKLKCKGITVYRYGTNKKQVLAFGSCHSGPCLF